MIKFKSGFSVHKSEKLKALGLAETTYYLHWVYIIIRDLSSAVLGTV